ncbi:MAG: MarR family transcriptional regulator [Pseudomonadota bacterium]
MRKTHQTDAVFRVFNELGIINQLSNAEFQRALAPDLNTSEFGVLNHFVRVGDGKTPSELARIFQMTKPSMTAIIGKLEQKGFVNVIPSETDRRRKTIEITASGRTARDAGIAATAPLIETLQADFPVDDLLAIQPVLERLRIYLDQRRNPIDGL